MHQVTNKFQIVPLESVLVQVPVIKSPYDTLAQPSPLHHVLPVLALGRRI